MRKATIAVFLFVLAASVNTAFATNGDNVIGIGPLSRSMGGVGIASPEDAISAVFANPAAMCFAPYCPSSQVNFSGTLFMPHVSGSVSVGPMTVSADADQKLYPIPALGISYPISTSWPYWRFGFAAYGVSGMGVDYRSTALNQPNFFGPGAPLLPTPYTNLDIMKFAPSLAFQPTDNLSFGVALHIDYETLDLDAGTSQGFGFGAQIGAIYRVSDCVSLGLDYITPQNVHNDNVLSFNGALDGLQLEAPQQVGAGVSYTSRDNKLLLETDLKWLNWSGSTGYGAFDWRDQLVVALGGRYRLTDKLTLRAGYNYGQNPVRSHNGWQGFTSYTTVQGVKMPDYYYEAFRVLDFPAIVEHHVTFGLGYHLTPTVALYAGYMHAFGKSLDETGWLPGGVPVRLHSNLSEDSAEMGVTWRF